MSMFCYNLVKFFLVIINFLFWLVGLVIVGLAVWMFVDPTFHVAMTQDMTNYYISIGVLLTGGVLLVIVAFLGCCGAFKESLNMLIAFFFLLIIIAVSHAVTFAWGYINCDNLELLIRTTMKQTVQEEYANVPSRRATFDAIQSGLQCCGADGPTDWIGSKKISVGISSEALNFAIPKSCCREGLEEKMCIETATKAGSVVNHSLVYSEGCTEKVIDAIKMKIPYIIGIAMGILLIECIGLLFSLILMITIKRGNAYKA